MMCYPISGASSEEVKNWLLRPWSLLKQIEAWNMCIPSPSPVRQLLPSVICWSDLLKTAWLKPGTDSCQPESYSPGVTNWKVSPVEIDNVAYRFNDTFAQNNNYDSMALRRIADSSLLP